jgi:glutamate racemase
LIIVFSKGRIKSISTQDEDFKKNAIGVFDSGVGGLTVFREILKALPNEDCFYLGDTARLPYGTKSKETVTTFAVKNTEFLVSLGIKFLVVACNTAASAGLETIEEKFDIPTIGVVLPGAEKAVKATKNGKVGVIGTRSTIMSGAYKAEITNINPDVQVFQQPCPLFVPLAEEGWTENEVAHLVAEEYLAGFSAHGVDTLILGCTHYPLLKKAIQQAVGYEVQLVDSALPIAWEVKKRLEKMGIERKENERKFKFFVTDDPENFIRVGEPFLGHKIDDVEHVDIVV